MQILIEFSKILLPAGSVLYAMYLVVKMFLTKELEKKMLDIKLKNTDIVLPIRLQAYERVCLFLERIDPNNIIIRLNASNYLVGEFQQILLREIREEYSHNLSQQIYLTQESWNLAKNAMEEIVVIINESAESLDPKAKSIELAKVILDKTVQREQHAISFALQQLKQEIAQFF